MSFPSPSEAPDAFLDHLKALNLDLGLEIFTHYRTRPSEASDGRLDEARAKSWCGGMDMLLGKLHRLEKSQPEHQALLSAIGKLGAKGITRINEQLAEQKKADAAAKEKCDDEERSQVEQARLAAERADQDRVERLRRLDSERAAFEHAKQELALKEKAFQDAQKSVAGDNDNDGDGNDDDDKNDDEGSESPPEQQAGTSKKPTKRELEQETHHGKLPQVTHSTPCQLCSQKSGKCVGPVGLACDTCWRQKKSCTNGHNRAHKVVIKEEPRSPAQSAPCKRKACPSIDPPLWTANQLKDDVSTSTQSLGKHPRMSASAPSTTQFDGVVITKPPRRSMHVAKTGSKKDIVEVYRSISKAHATLLKSYEDLAEMAAE
ncbi:hypothetical protein BJV78DRAFT_1159259 [Lactifluus subvellereus]|nr:hypothetical protein BJV78DRAFT_1159259 [Lactifluus subvellereus]